MLGCLKILRYYYVNNKEYCGYIIYYIFLFFNFVFKFFYILLSFRDKRKLFLESLYLRYNKYVLN